MRSNIERAKADLGVITKTEVEAIIKKSPDQMENTLQLQVVKAVYSTFEDA